MSVFGRLIAVAAVIAASVGAGTVSLAQEIRYFVVQSSGLFEIAGPSTGGRFVIAPTGEQINVSGLGVLPVRGRTDRAQRGESVVTQVRGAGIATVSVTFQPQTGGVQTVFSGTLPLPFVVPRRVSLSSNVDNLTVSVGQNGRVVSRRLPIGSR